MSPRSRLIHYNKSSSRSFETFSSRFCTHRLRDDSQQFLKKSKRFEGPALNSMDRTHNCGDLPTIFFYLSGKILNAETCIHSHHDLNSLSSSTDRTSLLGTISSSLRHPAPRAPHVRTCRSLKCWRKHILELESSLKPVAHNSLELITNDTGGREVSTCCTESHSWNVSPVSTVFGQGSSKNSCKWSSGRWALKHTHGSMHEHLRRKCRSSHLPWLPTLLKL